MDHFRDSHDLRLEKWGPYTKRYMGISHITDQQKGLRFDLSVIPGFYRRRVDLPNVLWESPYHPWEAAPDLTYYAHRHQLEWKDRIYCDVSFSKIASEDLAGAGARLIRTELVNNTAEPQSLALHYMAYLNFPAVQAYSNEAIELCEAFLPPGAIWLDALDYQDLEFARPRPTDNLGYDGFYRAEQRGHGFVTGSGIGQGFGRDKGDQVKYRLEIDHPLENGTLFVRYRLAPSQESNFNLTFYKLRPGSNQGKQETTLRLSGRGGFALAQIELGQLSAGEYTFELISQGQTGVELDGFVLAENEAVSELNFEQMEWKATPEISPGPVANSLVLKYEQVEGYYGLAWDYGSVEVR